MLVQRRGRTTAADLARRLEVSERTIYRDLEALATAGVPVYSRPGRGGGVYLVDGYRIDLSGLSLGEAELLPLLGLGDAVARLGFGGSLARTEAKLLAALPDAQRERAEHLRRKIHVDLSAWWHPTEAVPHLPALVEAAFTGRKVRVRYRRGSDGSVVQRTLGPLGLVVKAGVWYLVAAAGTRGPRVYRTSRILAARILDVPFAAKAGFDLAAFWASRAEEFQTTGTYYNVVVRARPEAVRALTSDHASETPTGWTRLELTFGSRNHALQRLLALGPAVVVERPDDLRDEVARTLRDASANYPS
jgi:predicted DNA-binding transcriptional regulator YafY